MAKQDPATATKFDALLKKCLAAWDGEEAPPRDPVAQFIVGMLQWNATRDDADDAFAALMDAYIDTNDLRVSHPHELVELLGDDYPEAAQRVLRLKQALDMVYRREHDIHMNSIAGKSKKEQRLYLDTLPGVPPFVAAQTTLLAFGGHAMPVDDKLCALLINEGCLDEGTNVVEAEAYLVRLVKAGDAVDAHLALQAWADGQDVDIDLTARSTPPPPEAAGATATATKPRKKVSRKKK